MSSQSLADRPLRDGRVSRHTPDPLTAIACGGVVIDLPAFNRFRPLLLITAGALGLGMLVGNAQNGPLVLRTVLEVFVGRSFVACGTYLWRRRPANRLGRLMSVVGCFWPS